MSRRPPILELGFGVDGEALAAALELLFPGRVGVVTVYHDDGCPCLAGRPMTACTCPAPELEPRR